MIREKANANMITYEAIIMNRSNKTSEWRKNVSPEKRSLMMKWARESASKQTNFLTNTELSYKSP